MDYDIRRIGLEDIDTFIHFRECMFREVGLGDGVEAMSRDSVSYFEEKIPTDEFVGWLAETPDGKAAASAGLSIYHLSPKPMNIRGKYGYVSSFYTMEPHRRRGLAKRLLDEVIGYARQIELPVLKLHASPYGKPIYLEAGFEDLNEMGLGFANK